MNATKTIFIGLIVILASIFVIGLFLPANTHVERSIKINANDETVFRLINNFREFNRWSPWAAKDKNTQYTFEGPVSGEGAAMSWVSEHPQVGNGSQKIEISSPYSHIVTSLNFGSMGGAKASFKLDEEDGNTTVVWGFDVKHDMNPINRIFGMFMMDKWVGGDYEVGLQNLKQLAEQEQQNALIVPQITQEEITYSDGETTMQGYIVYDANAAGKRPGILVVHEWWGHNEYARSRAEQLARMGYVAFALDMYGDGKNTAHPKEAQAFMAAATADPLAAKGRFMAALSTLTANNYVDSDRIGAIGYCFGGAVVLNMARAGVEGLDGVVSFHGSLAASNPATNIASKVLVLHGADDPFVPAEQVDAFKKEMDSIAANYEFVAYPGVKHSFTNPGADAVGEKFDLPLEYNAEADRDSWQRMASFFEGIF